MSDEYKKKIGVPESHTLNIVSSQWSQRKGQDTDTYECEELNEQGDVIHCTVHHKGQYIDLPSIWAVDYLDSISRTRFLTF